MIWRKKRNDKSGDNKIILGMIMHNENEAIDFNLFAIDFKNSYRNNIGEISGENTSFTFKVDNEMVGIGHMDIPIPKGDIEGTSKFAYNWQTVLEDTKDHKSHLIVSVMQGDQNEINRYKIFTQVICSLLRTTNAIGVYKGNQSLLIAKQDYLNEAEAMNEEYLPLNLWIYFGLYKTDKGNVGYTCGLKEFNKTEIEIVNSSKKIEEIREFLFNVSHYVLENDVTFKDKQTVGGSADEKITISFSKGQFVEGNTFKLDY
jgi:hypothetical protein